MNDMALRPRNGLSLCAGGGGLDMGLMLAEPGFHTRCFVEWEEYPRRSIIAGQRTGYFAPAPIWGDLTTFDAKPLAGAIDTLLAGYPCFVAGTVICTKRGHIPIEEVVAGDMVLTHMGRWRPVTATMRKPSAPVRRIKAQGVPGIVCTDEHPFYLEGGQWRAAEDIRRGDRVGQVLPDVDHDAHSPEFWWVIGRYLADGWRQWSPSQRDRKRGRVSICCARHEGDEVRRRIAAAGFEAYRSEERTTTRFAITKHSLYEFCAQFGTGAAGKHLPGWVLGLDEARARALCEGYFSGDGYRYDQPKGGSGWRITTVSKALALSFGALAQRAFGVVASVRRQSVAPSTEIEGRVVRQREQFILTVPDRNRSGRIDGRYGWKCVRGNEPCGIADVFNIAVDEDESYVADGAIVHNCQPFSQAGQRRGEDDERHLWPDVARVARELGDGLEWIFLENVDGHLSLGGETVLRELRQMGFTPAGGLFSAGEVGAPHRRLRLFIVAHRHRGGGRPEQQPDRARERRGEPEGSGRQLADTHGGNAGAEREFSSGQFGLQPEGGGVGHGADLADAGEPGLQGRERGGASGQRDGTPAPGSAAEFREAFLFPPGPSDRAAWAAILAGENDDLAPALGIDEILARACHRHASLQDPAPEAVESAIRRMANGLATRTRALRLLGNGVVPLAAAYAWRSLAAAHGLGPVDMGAADRDAAGFSGESFR